jgi:hypothetical protein
MSLRIAQSSDQVTRASPPSVSGGFTLLGWVRLRADRDDYQTIGRVSVNNGTIVTWSTDGNGTSGPNYFTVGGSVANSTGLAVDAWRKVAISCTGTTGKTYVQDPGNATEVDSGTVSSSGTPDLLALGGRGEVAAGEWFNGNLAYVRLFATELTQAQIEAEWQSPTAVLSAWADWPLSTDLLDISGNGRHLTAGSTASGGFEDDPPVGATAVLAGTAPRATGTLAAEVRNVAVLAGTAPAAVGTLAGAVRNLGVLAGSAPVAIGDLAAEVRNVAVLAGGAPVAVGALAGEVRNLGVLAGSAPAAVGTLRQAVPSAQEAIWRAGVPVLAGGWSGGAPVLAGSWRAGVPV